MMLRPRDSRDQKVIEASLGISPQPSSLHFVQDEFGNHVAIANASPYGLNNSVFTPDVERAMAVAQRLRSGTVGHNAFRSDFSIAFGGYKQSGIGREGGREGLRPYLEAKTVILDAPLAPA